MELNECVETSEKLSKERFEVSRLLNLLSIIAFDVSALKEEVKNGAEAINITDSLDEILNQILKTVKY